MKHSIYAAFKVLGEGKLHVVLLFLSSRVKDKAAFSLAIIYRVKLFINRMGIVNSR